MSTTGAGSAAVVSFSINQTFAQGDGQSDIPETAVSIGSAGQFFVDPGISSNYLDFRFAVGTFSTVTSQNLEGYFFLQSFAEGDEVGISTLSSDESAEADWDTILVDDDTLGVWDSSHEGFLGFIADGGEYGYIGYDYTRSGGVSTLNLKDGAYESIVGQPIQIGEAMNAIPEPSSTMALGALFGLGLFVRRK